MTRGRRWSPLLIPIVAMAILTQACSGEDSGVRETFSFPPNLTVNGWEGWPVETFCLEAHETFDRVASSLTPFAEEIEAMLTRGAAQVVEADCDATITTDIEGRALQGNYTNVGGLYTGWDISGTITLTAAGRPPLVVQLDTHQEPPSSTRLDRASAGQPEHAIRRAAGTAGDGVWRHDFKELFTCGVAGCPR